MEQDEIYGEFAYVYDEFMDNIPYEQWHDYLHGLLIKYGVTDGIVADLACGTGTMTKLLADRKSTRLNSSHPPESRMPSSA